MTPKQKIALVKKMIKEQAEISPPGLFCIELADFVDLEATGGIPDEAPVLMPISEQKSVIKRLEAEGFVANVREDKDNGRRVWLEVAEAKGGSREKRPRDISPHIQSMDGEKIDLRGIPREHALFLLKLIISRIYYILEAVSTGYIHVMDDNLNAKYVLLSDNLSGILGREDFKELKNDLGAELLPKHLFEPADEMETWWECGGQAGIMSFIGDVESAWVRAGQRAFSIPGWLGHYFDHIDATTTQHKKDKAEKWGRIMKNFEERKARGEFSFDGKPPIPPAPSEKKSDNVLKVEIVAAPEFRVRDIDESVVSKGKRKVSLPKFKPTDWSFVSWRFIDDRNVLLGAEKKTVTADYEGLGFSNDKSNSPNRAWRFLLEMAKHGGETEVLGAPIPDTIKQVKRQAADRLKTIFKNDTDPFYDPSETRRYRAKFKLIPPETESEASRDDLGIHEALGEYNG